MAKTFIYRAKNLTMYPGFNCLAAIINQQEDAVLEIKSIRLAPLKSQTTTASPRYWMSLIRKNSVATTFEKQITPVKFDTNSASLPPQVLIYENPEPISNVNTYLYRNITNYFTNASTFLSHPLAGGGFRSGTGGRTEHLVNLNKGSVIEPIILREGEGISCSMLIDTDDAYRASFDIIITNNSTGATYLVKSSPYFTPKTTFAHTDLLTIYNGASSGVVLTLRIINISINGVVLSSTTFPSIRLAKIDDINTLINSDNIVSAISNDTYNVLPSNIKLYKGPINVRYQGSSRGIPDDESSLLSGETLVNILRRGVLGYRNYFIVNTLPIVDFAATQKYFFRDAFEIYNSKNCCGFKIRDKEGFGILVNKTTLETALDGFICDIEIVFTYTQYGSISKNRIIGNT